PPSTAGWLGTSPAAWPGRASCSPACSARKISGRAWPRSWRSGRPGSPAGEAPRRRRGPPARVPLSRALACQAVTGWPGGQVTGHRPLPSCRRRSGERVSATTQPGVLPLRPLTVGELLDAAVSLLRARGPLLIGLGVAAAALEQLVLFPYR